MGHGRVGAITYQNTASPGSELLGLSLARKDHLLYSSIFTIYIHTREEVNEPQTKLPLLLVRNLHYSSFYMGSCLPLPLPLLTNTSMTTKAISVSKRKKTHPLPIDTTFNLPSPPPSWPSGTGFAGGSIDLGGLEVRQVSTFAKVWASHDGGPDDLGATFFSPSPVPSGFSILGSYAQSNNKPLFGFVLVARNTSTTSTALASPIDYTLIWSSNSTTQQDSPVYFWLPIAPNGYKAVGCIVTSSPAKPSLDDVRCVRADLTDTSEDDSWVWGSSGDDGINVYGLRPTTRGVQALGVGVGTFMTQRGGSTNTDVACLKNNNSNLTYMPNLSQVKTLMQAYSPLIYFHPDESYLPSSVSWFFSNGALLYPNGAPIDPTGSNLPQGGTNDGTYWIDLPADDQARQKIKQGDLQTAEPYLHIKPMLGGTFTDIAIWFFYPFNGPAKAKVEFFNIPLGRIGEHVGDWEHLTLRISNFSGELHSLYFSEHSAGSWVDASQLEFATGNKPVAYASLNGHAFYPKAGLVLQGNTKLGIGIRNDTAKGKYVMDCGAGFEVVGGEYLGTAVVEPPWLEYMREWGPKVSYDLEKELAGLEKLLPRKQKNALENFVKGLPDEVLGEEGPTGPKEKDNWSMDERVAS